MSPRPGIEGKYFDARTSNARPARLAISADGRLQLESEGGSREFSLASVRISDRIADVPRRITFDDSAVFESPDNDAIDAALAATGRGGFGQRLGRWERLWTVAIAALAGVAILSYAFVRFGMPWLADAAASALPPAVDARIGFEGLELLDRTLLEPTRLPGSRQAALRRRLQSMTQGDGGAHVFRLEFRRGGSGVGPNAFALPSGIIVVTDELVALAERDEEIDAVLAHEVGHVRGRHALRILLQNAGTAALAVALLGDIGSTSSLAAAVPVLLVQAKHSRDFEREADAYARSWLRERGLPETHFDDVMCRMAQDEPAFSYLSSHPPLRERAACAARPPNEGESS